MALTKAANQPNTALQTPYIIIDNQVLELGKNNTLSGFITLPSQTGNSGRILTTNGTIASWAIAPTSATSTTEGLLFGRTPTTASGSANLSIGFRALNSLTNGTTNLAIGYNALLQNTNGSGNLAIGLGSLQTGTTTNSNVGIGYATLINANSDDNVAIGYAAMQAGGTGRNVGIGSLAMTNLGGGSNIAIGYNAFLGNGISVSGSGNTVIGTSAQTFSGSNFSGSNNIIIGQTSSASSLTASNEVTLGNSSITRFRVPGLDIDWNGAFLEKTTIFGGAPATGTIAYDLLTNRNILYYTTNASGNWTLNVRGNSTTTLDSLMSTGQSLTVVFMNTNGATAYYQTGFQVDGVSVTPKWQGGSAPAAGNASSIDIYTITIIKTGSATFTALAQLTKFA